jgi:hypothetical protein
VCIWSMENEMRWRLGNWEWGWGLEVLLLMMKDEGDENDVGRRGL